MRDQRVRDPIHDLIKFAANSGDDVLLWQLLQTEPVQRLRRIRQLGFSEFVYPGASHTRIAHVLGAMQMARRMLDVLERNDVIGSEADHALWRTGTLCAALLHDVGHGPFSHVFEEVSKSIGVVQAHEDYTRRIISETEVADVLRPPGASSELLDATRSFFEGEPGDSPYFQIVSSQLDADRLDFLLRDQYFTGIGVGRIDLEWILDSLFIEQVPIELGSEVRQYSFVVREKGLSALEIYLLSYYQMYSKVYFHKTTRGVQFLVRDIMNLALAGEEVRERLPEGDPLRDYFGQGPEPDLGLFLSLDDNSVLALISYLAKRDIGELSQLSRRFLARDLYKCFEPPHKPDEPPPLIQVSNFKAKLEDQEIFFHSDRLQPKGYKEFEIIGEGFLQNILVESGGDYVPVGRLSPIVENIPVAPTIRFYFRNEEERLRAKALWHSL